MGIQHLGYRLQQLALVADRQKRFPNTHYRGGTRMKPDETPVDESIVPLFEKFDRAVEEGDFETATGAVEDVFAHVNEWAEKSPSPDLDLTTAAAEFEACADWCSAEAMYKRILSLPDAAPHVESIAHSHLSGLCRLLHRDADSLDHASRATAVARRSDLPMLLLRALERQSRCLLGCGRIAEARDVIAEAIPMIDNDAAPNQMRAKFLISRAECALRDGALAEAEPDLEEAYRLLEPLAEMEMAAGVHGDLSRWWSVTARLRTQCDDRDGAISAWREAVEISKHVDSLPQVVGVYTKASIADMLKGLAEALSAAGRTDEAAVVLEERDELLERIGVPDDTAGRETSS